MYSRGPLGALQSRFKLPVTQAICNKQDVHRYISVQQQLHRTFAGFKNTADRIITCDGIHVQRRTISCYVAESILPVQVRQLSTGDDTSTHAKGAGKISNHSVLNWSAGDVANWLATIGYSQYGVGFVEDRVNGRLLIHLDQDDLEELGVKSQSDCRALLKAIAALKIVQKLPGVDEINKKQTNTQGTSPPTAVQDRSARASAHALLSPSGAHRWLECTRSARLEALLPEIRTRYSQEGTFAHTVAAIELLEALRQGQTTAEVFHDTGVTAEHGKVMPSDNKNVNSYVDVVSELQQNKFYDSDLAAAVEQYVQYVVEAAQTADSVFIEQRVSLERYVPNGYGTADVVLVSGNRIRVIDLKFGRGVRVDAYNNPQLWLYALGAYENYLASGGDASAITEIEVSIYQPRLFACSPNAQEINPGLQTQSGSIISPEDTQIVSLQELLHWGEHVVQPKAKAAHEGTGEFQPGPACQYCRARSNCRARADWLTGMWHAEEVIEKQEDTDSNTAHDWSEARQSPWYNRLDFADSATPNNPQPEFHRYGNRTDHHNKAHPPHATTSQTAPRPKNADQFSSQKNADNTGAIRGIVPATLPPPPLLREEEIADILSKANEIRKWLQDVRDYATATARGGGATYPGFHLSSVTGTRRYLDHERVTTTLLSAGLSEDQIFSKKLRSVRQLEMAVGVDTVDTLLVARGLVVRSAGEPTLVRGAKKGTASSI